MQLRPRQQASSASAVDVQCQRCGRADFKGDRGLAMHLSRSNCAEQHKQHQTQAPVVSTLPSVDSLFGRPLLITVENFFVIFINVPTFVKHAMGFLMLLYGHVNAFVGITGIFNSIYFGCVFVWTLCTDPDNISAPFLPNSVQPYWNAVYYSLNTHVDMAFWSSRLFGVWKFLVVPVRIDPEVFYAKVENNPSLPFCTKAVITRLCKTVELLIGSYLLSKILFWSFHALVIFMLFAYYSLKRAILSYLN